MSHKIVISTNNDSYKEGNMINNIIYLFSQYGIERAVDITTIPLDEIRRLCISNDNTLFFTSMYTSMRGSIVDKGSMRTKYTATLFIRIINDKVNIIKNRYVDLGIKDGDNLKQLIRDKKLSELI